MTTLIEKSTRIQNLVSSLEKASSAYHSGNPIISDAAYDALEDELRLLDPENAFLKKIGAPTKPTSGWQKVKHGAPMGSLNKAQIPSEMDAWAKNCGYQGGENLVVMEKLDGLSCSLRYENGTLTQALTRGDGMIGEDITSNFVLTQGSVKKIPKFTGHVRGEIICRKSDFDAYFPGQSNPRNTASGTIKRQSDPESCRFLTFMAFQMIPNEGYLETKTQELQRLKKSGFLTPNWIKVPALAGVYAHYQQYIDKVRKSLDYDIDGLVIQFDDSSRFLDLGELNHRPKGSVAFKFPHEEKETTLTNIIWQVGNSGRITPVAEFEDVLLAGANVTRASLYNISNIESLLAESPCPKPHIQKGDKILVSRKNDVIPAVEELLGSDGFGFEFTVPTECPSCSTTLERDGEYLVCRGENCPAQVAGAIKRWIKKLGILHFGDALVEALIDAGMVSDIADLYTLDPDVVESVTLSSGRRAGGSAKKALANLNKKKILDLHVFVGSLGIPLIGRGMAKIIVDGGYDSLHRMAMAQAKDIAAIPGVGNTKAISFYQGYWDKVDLIAKILGVGVKIKKTGEGLLKGKTFCLTGFRDPQLQDAIEEAGGVVKSGVSKTLDVLVLLDPTSTSGKAQKAREYNVKGSSIKLIGVEEAWGMTGQLKPT